MGIFLVDTGPSQYLVGELEYEYYSRRGIADSRWSSPAKAQLSKPCLRPVTTRLAISASSGVTMDLYAPLLDPTYLPLLSKHSDEHFDPDLCYNDALRAHAGCDIDQSMISFVLRWRSAADPDLTHIRRSITCQAMISSLSPCRFASMASLSSTSSC